LFDPTTPGVTTLTHSTALFGFYGKIPARGDFVRAGLPRDFIDPWDCWLQQVMAESRALLGEDWLPAWMEAPIWRFRLRPGLCGALPALGVFMPSVDKAGRHFPLTLACVGETNATGLGWLGQAEAVGLAALEHDLNPDQLTDRLLPNAANSAGSAEAGPALPDGPCVWWTEGAPRVAPTAFATSGLPDSARFARMLQS
jgi:type VI secretion system protein ImpM